MSDYVSAVSAYKRVLDANRKIKPSTNLHAIKPMDVLRQGDDLVRMNSDVISSQSVTKPSFEQALNDELIKKPINTIRSESKNLFRITKEGADTDNQSLLDLIKTVDTMDITVKSLVAVRDKIVSAYLDILKMPI